MHILEIPSFFPPYGGLFCLDQAKALAGLGHEVRILSNVQVGMTVGLKDYLTLPFRRYTHEMDGITVCQSYQRGIPKLVRHNVQRWVSIVCSMYDDYVAKYGRPDILHAHCAKWAGYAAMKIAEAHHLPYVITEHLPLMLLEQEFGPAPSTAWQIPLLREAYEKAGLVITVSEELVDDIACYYGKNYKWQYVSNTIDTSFFAYRSRERKDRPFRFCCVADYSYRKGYDVLFNAYGQVQQQHEDVELHIAGLFTDGAKCQKEIERLHLKGVTAYGRVDKERIRQILYASDALVLPSRSEVQPLVLLEAMSTGIPVISTECIPRCIRIEKGCTIVPIGDALALAKAMLSVLSASDVDMQGVSNEVRALASPEVVGKRLEELFREQL